MKMKKKLLIIMIFVMILSISLCLVGCSDGKLEIGGGLWQFAPDSPNNPNNQNKPDEPVTPEVTVPTDLKVTSAGLLSWSKIAGASNYDIEINGNIIEGHRFTSYSLLLVEPRPADGVFNIRVRAVNEEDCTGWSEAIVYTHKGSAMVYPSLDYSDGKLIWSTNSSAKNVSVTVNGKENLLDADSESFDLSQCNEDAVISVKFVGDGVYVLDSQAVTVKYLSAKGTVHYPAPQNVRMDGDILKFDEVLGANVYYIQDVNNTVTTITDLESDRSNKFLVKSVWAGNTDISIGESEGSEVSYFSIEKGDGSEGNPFIISTPEEMRYIEYYESVNLSMNYKLSNDIVLAEYSPKDDEDYSNFYNLGSFSGVLDGNGYALSNTAVYYKDGYSSIFDSIAKTGVVKNLVFDNANWRTWTVRTNDGNLHNKGGECSILAYTNRGLVENVTIRNSSIYAVRDGASGLVSINKGSIINCTIESTTTIYGANESGGIAIFNSDSGTVKGCKNYGSVSGNTTVGGIVARNNGIITECGNEGDINATTYAGGIVGYNANLYDGYLQFQSSVSLSYNAGTINVTSYGGGIAGKNGGDGINEVGKMSYANAQILSCYNVGKLIGANGIGGIVGDNYGFNEEGSPLGVVNCYSDAQFDVEADRLKSSRVYLDYTNCSWMTADNAQIYLYYWGKGSSVSWPGIRMNTVSFTSKRYYYADIGIEAEALDGIIFVRMSPEGAEWNKTDDIELDFKSGKLCLVINESFSNATATSSSGLVSGTPLTIGGIAGFNNMINDCYYVKATAMDKNIEAGVATDTQENKIFLGRNAATSADCAVDNVSELVDKLNAVNDVWVLDGEKLILKWQAEGARS